MSSAPPLVLALAASDPTGGAGVQADLLTLADLGCHPLSVITALTVQDTHGVEGVLPIDADWVARQARHVLRDMRVAAFKLGVLGSAQNIEAIAGILVEHPRVPVVVDPVLASGRGDALAGEEALAALIKRILPLATVATPNTLEAKRLGGVERILATGCQHVLLTGTHEATPEVVNRLYGARGMLREDRWQRLPGSYHGSGCTLASALAAGLAKGLPVSDAARAAQEYTWNALSRGFRPGGGQAIPDRLRR